MNDDQKQNQSTLRLGRTAALSVLLLWMAQPPWMLWPLAMVALVPWLTIITTSQPITRRGYLTIWALSTLYWLLSLQGLRHAHPMIFICLIALGCYLATFHVLFVTMVRRMSLQRIPLMVAVPVVWVGQECLRNYLLTGISAAMLGHTMADVPRMVQIADLFGTYGVSFVLALANVAAFSLYQTWRRKSTIKRSSIDWGIAAIALGSTVGYGEYRLREPLGDAVATFALVQRSEVVQYEQPIEREIEMFHNYARQSIDAAAQSDRNIDVFVWPESMFSGGTPWMIADPQATAPQGTSMTPSEFQAAVHDSREYFLRRAAGLQGAIASARPNSRSPHLLVGCGVTHYKDVPNVYSGVISIRPDGSLQDWYGKTHLVMFGEYVPIAPSIPGIRSLIPPGMGLHIGPGAKRFMVNDTSVSPNICIETAVERVTVNQLASLRRRDAMPDVVVTVTNDGWFDDSSVIDHHLRCAQLVAVGCRRPLLSAANNGPTAWIDSCGRIVDSLATGTNGAVIATPDRDHRTSLYVRIGDWPARLCLLSCGLILVAPLLRTKRLASDA